MKNSILSELSELKTKKDIDKKIFKEFEKRIKKGKLIRSENPFDHLCTFFVPINTDTKSVFMGHHINADLWLPPGGHIEKGESPHQTVAREMAEELAIKKNKYKTELFDLSITDVVDKKRTCKKHYDFWYLIYTPRLPFNFDRKEFFQAEWLLIDLAIDRATHKTVTTCLNKLKNLLDRL